MKMNLDDYKNLLDQLASSQQGGSRKLLKEQQKVFKKLQESGLPDKKQEEWRFSNPEKVFEGNYKLASAPENFSSAKFDLIKDKFEHIITFVDGAFSEDHSKTDKLQKEAHFSELGQHIKQNESDLAQLFSDNKKEKKNSLKLLNNALASDGVVLNISDNTIIETPIAIFYLQGKNSQDIWCSPRNIINLGKNSRASLIEICLGEEEGVYFINKLSEISLDSGAKLEHVKVQADSKQAKNISMTDVSVAKDANYRSFVAAFGANYSRDGLHVDLLENGASTQINGIYTLNESQQSDHYTRIDHNSAYTESEQLYKGILSDTSKAVFNGKVLVHKDACQVNSNQLNKNLLFGQKAKIHTHPTLLIDNDDVKCTHGATVGQIDPEQIFYLRSRGFSDEKARQTLAHAFSYDALLKIENKTIQEICRLFTEEKFLEITTKGESRGI
jgi:Fe-S cluster assembly protein SufD